MGARAAVAMKSASSPTPLPLRSCLAPLSLLCISIATLQVSHRSRICRQTRPQPMGNKGCSSSSSISSSNRCIIKCSRCSSSSISSSSTSSITTIVVAHSSSSSRTTTTLQQVGRLLLGCSSSSSSRTVVVPSKRLPTRSWTVRRT